jgi:hypothetical protein
MNALIEKLPTVAEINGVEYELDTDFRTCLNIILAFEDIELTKQEKNIIMLKLLYKYNIPQDIKKATEIAVLFLNCGEENKEESEAEQRVFSFEKDSSYIYTALNQTYNIDLESVDYLHWWKFCLMFRDLKEDCFFTRLVDLRNRKNRGKLSKEEKEYCFKISDIIDLSEQRTSEEIYAEDEFMRRLNSNIT